MQLFSWQDITCSHSYTSVFRRFSSSMEPDIHVYSISSKEVEFKIRTNGVGVRTFAVSSLFRQGYQYIGFIDEQCTAYIHRLNTTSGETGKIYASSDLENRLGKVVSVGKIVKCI